MARRTLALVQLLPMTVVGVLVAAVPGEGHAATPTYYADPMVFQADITSTVTDDYSDPAYVFNQNNATMSGVIGETDYMSTGHVELNLVVGAPGDPRYCSGCNGSFLLSFQTTSVGTPAGVNGVGVTIDATDNTYFAFITFADGTTDEMMLPAVGSFWGVAAPERIESIHFGLTAGGTTTGGYLEIDDLIVGDGNVGGCVIDADCFDNGDVCTDPVCVGGFCDFAPNTDPCDDGDPCTEMDTCDMGVCSGPPTDCNDGNPCTTNVCDPMAGCILQLNSDPCDDGDVCTEMDTCDMGMCMGMALDCNDDNVCSMDSCDPVMGCVNEPQMGCCLTDDECGEEEMCDPGTNACVPIPAGSTGDTGVPGDTGDSGVPGDTGVDGTGNGDSGGGSGTPDTGDTGPLGGSTSGVGSSGTGDGGEIPPPDFSACDCRTDGSPRGRMWWLLAGFGLLVRRRRGARG